MHPITHAAARPDHAAIINATSGEQVTYGELDAFANRMARWLRAQGITRLERALRKGRHFHQMDIEMQQSGVLHCRRHFGKGRF